MKTPPLIVVAHAVAPGPGGAEAEVNANFLGALALSWPAPISVIAAGSTAPAALAGRGGTRSQCVFHALGECGELEGTAASRIAAWCLRRLRAGGAGSVPARAINRLSHEMTGQGVKRAWNGSASRVLRQELSRLPGAVVYSRALPLASIEAVAAVRRRTAFTWIVNFNDPLPAGLWPGQYPTSARTDQRADAVLRRALPHISAFTFSSEGLRGIEHGAYPSMTAVPSLVLPHVAPPAAAPPAHAAPHDPSSRRLQIVFLGTLRSNRVRPEFFEGLRQSVSADPLLGTMRVSFLVPVANAALLGARDSLPSIVDVTVAPSADAIARAAEGADVLLDLESEADGPLMLAKISRYASCGKPVWAICAEGGTTWKLAAGHAWGYVTALGDAGAVGATLRQIHADWQDGRLARRGPSAAVADCFSGDRVVSELAQLCRSIAHTTEREASLAHSAQLASTR